MLACIYGDPSSNDYIFSTTKNAYGLASEPFNVFSQPPSNYWCTTELHNFQIKSLIQ
jgi:hypothetical protein